MNHTNFKVQAVRVFRTGIMIASIGLVSESALGEDRCWKDSQAVSVKEETIPPKLKQELEALRQRDNPGARQERLAQLQELERQFQATYARFLSDAKTANINDAIAQFLASARPVGPAFRAYCNVAAALPGSKSPGALSALSASGAACEKGFAWAEDFLNFLNCHSGDGWLCAKTVLKTIANQSGRDDFKRGVDRIVEGKEGMDNLKNEQYVQALKNVCALGSSAKSSDIEKLGSANPSKHACKAVASIDKALDYDAEADRVLEEKIDREQSLQRARQTIEQRLGALRDNIAALERSIEQEPREQKWIEEATKKKQWEKYTECKSQEAGLDKKAIADIDAELDRMANASDEERDLAGLSSESESQTQNSLLRLFRDQLRSYRNLRTLNEASRPQREPPSSPSVPSAPNDFKGKTFKGKDFEIPDNRRRCVDTADWRCATK